jgi:hypothetical protein
MKNSKLNDLVRNFLLSEGQASTPSIKSRFLALEEMLSRINGRSLAEIRRLEIIGEQLRGLKREVKKLEEVKDILEEENSELREKLTLLEESKEE